METKHGEGTKNRALLMVNALLAALAAYMSERQRVAKLRGLHREGGTLLSLDEYVCAYTLAATPGVATQKSHLLKIARERSTIPRELHDPLVELGVAIRAPYQAFELVETVYAETIIKQVVACYTPINDSFVVHCALGLTQDTEQALPRIDAWAAREALGVKVRYCERCGTVGADEHFAQFACPKCGSEDQFEDDRKLACDNCRYEVEPTDQSAKIRGKCPFCMSGHYTFRMPRTINWPPTTPAV